MMMKNSRLMLALLASSVLLSGCVGAAIGAGAALGVSAAKEGGLQTSVKDESIRLKISDLWFRRSTEMFGKLNLTVNQGRVLVTGVVQKPEDRVEAIRLAWQPKGVKQVINEIRVGNSDTFGTYAKDTWIAGQLRTRLTFEKTVQSINYSIEVVQGTVYLMGVAQNQQELDRVISISRRISGVKEVISYVKLAGIDADVGPSGGTASGAVSQETVNAVPLASVESQPVSLSPSPLSSSDDMTSQPYAPSASSGAVQSGGSSSIQSEVLPP